MTTIMQRPRSTQPHDYTFSDLSRSSHSRTASHSYNHSLSAGLASPTSQALGTSSHLGDQLASLQRELLGDTTISSSSSTLDMAGTSGLAEREDSDTYVKRGRAGEGLMNMEKRERGEELQSGMGHDSAVMALMGQSSQLQSGFELDIVSAQGLSNHLVDDVSGHLSDFELSSAATFQFPELPASLLDQAPEYEYSLHTQANVFDAVQEYGQAGNDEAGRIFGLDQYDPNLLDPQQASMAPRESYWNYQDSSGGVGGAFPQSQMGEYATFHDNSSLSDYPEPSTAPSSRASDWKQDPMTGSYHNTASSSFGVPLNYSLKRRRDSFDGNLNLPGVNLMSAYGRPIESMQHHMSHQGQQQLQYIDARPLRDSNTLIQNSRVRMASWTDEGVTAGQYADDWPPPPAPAPLVGSQFGQRMFGNDLNQSQHSYQGNAQLPGATNMMNNSMMARMRSTSSEDSGHSCDGHRRDSNNNISPPAKRATRNTSQNDLINAMGQAMDASMESDGIAKCPYPNCSKTFAKNRSYNLKAHLRSHSQLKPFACNHCPRAFSRKHDLERHARVHSGDKPYICEACGKGFPRSDALRRHWRVEKECGEKAVEIEAGQALAPIAPATTSTNKAPTSGMMTSNAPMLMSNYSTFSPSNHWENEYQQDRKRIRGGEY